MGTTTAFGHARVRGAPAAGRSREQRLEALMAVHADRAVRIAWRLVGGDAALAQDIAQDAFIRAYQGLDRFREEADMGSWFYRIVVNEALRHHRRERTKLRVLGLFQREAPEPHTVRSDPALQARITQALAALTPGECAAVVLVHMEEFTATEAAALLGRRPGTIKSQLHRGLCKLRERLRDEWEEMGR